MGGLLLVFKSWVPTEDDLRKRIDLLREKLREKANRHLHVLISNAVEDLAPEKLRDASSGKTDFIASYTEEILRVAHVFTNLDAIESIVRWAHALFIFSFVVSLVSGVIILASDLLRPLFGAVAILTIVLQVIIVFIVRRNTGRLASYERSC